jgi:hypothetical protein
VRNHILKTAVVVVFAFAAVAVTQIAAAANGCKGGHGKCRTTVSGKATTTAASSALRYRFTYGNGTAAITTGSYGWNLADVGGKSAADALPAGMKGLVWVGDYDNSTCNWQMSDATLTTKVKSMVGDPHVFGYFFSDEPYAEKCPSAPAQHAARNALIKSIDPTATTVIVLNANGSAHRATFPLWKTPTHADFIGIDPYPFVKGKANDWSLVTKSVQAADTAGFRYWFVVQSFENYEYRFPTAAELQTLLGMMGQSRAEGLMTFAWKYAGFCLCDHPDLLAVWNTYNHS